MKEGCSHKEQPSFESMPFILFDVTAFFTYFHNNAIYQLLPGRYIILFTSSALGDVPTVNSA